ncbi:hypothetical protein EDD17DRAFT_714944 [Pisolithus thermaeus]|nr:hypothetical protein EDD17DRAFT_714944 [Pisolithus thermaeus]
MILRPSPLLFAALSASTCAMPAVVLTGERRGVPIPWYLGHCIFILTQNGNTKKYTCNDQNPALYLRDRACARGWRMYFLSVLDRPHGASGIGNRACSGSLNFALHVPPCVRRTPTRLMLQ